MRLPIVLASLVCTATAAKHLLCACTRAEDNGEINDAVTQAIAANSKGRFTYSYHGWCKSDGAPRNGYYLFATKAWYQDIWVGGDEMHSMCVDEYNAGASVCFTPKIGAYDDVSERDLNTNHC